MNRLIIFLCFYISSLHCAAALYEITGTNGVTLKFEVRAVDGNGFTGYVENTTKVITVPWSKVDLKKLNEKCPELSNQYLEAKRKQEAEKNYDPIPDFKKEAGIFISKVGYIRSLINEMNNTAGNSKKALDVRDINKHSNYRTKIDAELRTLVTNSVETRVRLVATPNYKSNVECQKILDRLNSIQTHAPKLESKNSAVDRDAIIKITEALNFIEAFSKPASTPTQ